MESIFLKLGKRRSYPIIIDAGLLSKSTSFWPLKNGDNTVLVTNDIVAKLYLNILYDSLINAGVIVDKIIVPNGEKYKSLDTLNYIFTELLKKTYNRDITLIALGGGVIGDLTGFAAATYQRGVRFIQIPTTLLSQVDASIGGKTAVNHHLGKNMIGAFYHPSSVIIDVNCLKTLPHREIISGLAEVIKYAIALDIVFFKWLEQNLDSLLSLKFEEMAYCIRRCCELKTSIVMADEYEQNNIRALLNLGHTYGHAIEACLGYGKWLHGEAVSAGIMMAVQTSYYLGKISKDHAERIKKLLLRAGLPINGPIQMTSKDYLQFMKRDKKVISGQLRLVLPLIIGKAEVHNNVPDNIIKSSIEDCQNKL